MKCPKCGYNSFEYHNACTKCSEDFTAYKETYGLKAIVIPAEARMALAAQVGEPSMDEQEEIETEENSSDVFSFDLPEESVGQEPEATSFSNPFSFDDGGDGQGTGFGEFSFDDTPAAPAAAPATPATPVAPPHQEEDPFANLLESTAFGDDPFAAGDQAAEPPPADRKAPAAATAAPGEFDLDSFSWDEPSPQQEDELGDLFDKDDKDGKKE